MVWPYYERGHNVVKRPLEIYSRINLIILASDPDKAKEEVIGHEDHNISVEVSRNAKRGVRKEGRRAMDYSDRDSGCPGRFILIKWYLGIYVWYSIGHPSL